MKVSSCRLRVALVVFAAAAALSLCASAQVFPASVGQSTSARVVRAEYQNWLDQDVHWLISEEEQASFVGLATDKDRDRFVEEFWKRHDPTPGTQRNEFKEEHYRRIAYSNAHFAEAAPGWSTDRGRIYVLYGGPDEKRVETDSGPITEVWRYRHIVGRGANVEFRFTDDCSCGAYRLVEP